MSRKFRDIFEKFSKGRAARDLQDLRDSGIYPYFTELQPETNLPVSLIRQGDRLLANFGSNDYLGLTRHPQVISAALRASKTYGAGCSGSRLLNGTTGLHTELENELARFLGKEAALIFSTGFQSNTATLSALSDPKTCLIADEFAHASIEDGMRLAYGKTQRFRHNDLGSLRSILDDADPGLAPLVIVEGVYSIDGDSAPLTELVKLCTNYGARFYLDDAHGLGVLGRGGRGTAEHFGVEDQVDVLNGTFSKALGGVGGYIAGSAELIEFVKHYGTAFIYSASLPPACVASVRAALQVLQEEPERRERLERNAKLCRRLLSDIGLDLRPGVAGIVCFGVPSPYDRRLHSLAVGGLARALLENGFYVNPVLGHAATTPLLRIHVTADHSEEQISTFAEALSSLAPQFGFLSEEQAA